jgi:DNA-binding NarL/FixJ family response regulator
MRVVVADDSLITREGVAALLSRAGFEVVGQASSGEELLPVVDEQRPDVVLVDVRMPPTHTDEGLVAAREIRARHPQIGILVLSSHVEAGTAMRLLAETPTGLGYLLKDRVIDIDEFAHTLRRVAAGGSALDPEVFTRLLASRQEDGSLAALSHREREVLGLMAEGLSNVAIGERLAVTESAVRKHATAVFAKLGVAGGEDVNRRVLAVLSYLGGTDTRT